MPGFSLAAYAIRNIVRRPMRSGALSLGVAALSGTLLVLFSLYLSIDAGVERAWARLGADAMAVPSNWKPPEGGLLLGGVPTGTYLSPHVVERVSAYHGVAASSEQLFIVSASLACCSLGNTVLVGFDPETDFSVMPWLSGSIEKPLDSDEIVAGPEILSEPGGRIRFFSKVFRIAAKLEPTGMPMMDRAVFIPMAGAREMMDGSDLLPMKAAEGESSAVLLRFSDDINPLAVALRMEFEIPEVSVVLAAEAISAAKADLMVPLRAMVIVATLWWIVNLVLSGVLYGVAMEARVEEVRLLRNMGASRGHMLGMFTLEVLWVSFAGALAGVLAGWAVLGLIGGAGLTPMLPTGLSLALIGVWAILCSVVSALLSSVYALIKLTARS